MFARRKEIGIMRLVGATNWFIRLPFVIEGVVEGLLGAGAAILALFIMQVAFVDPLRGQVGFLPLVRTPDVIWTIPWLLLTGVAVSVRGRVSSPCCAPSRSEETPVSKRSPGGDRTVATNRKARHDFDILETFEAGIVLTGSGGEVAPLGPGLAHRGVRSRAG